MKVQLRTDLSTSNPDHVAALAARGDYMEDSLVDTSIDEALEGVKTDSDEYDREEALRTIHERLLRRGHFGPYEHAQAFFVVEGVSRVCMAQMRTHRHLSFDVQSMRYVNFDDAEMVTPESYEDAIVTTEEVEYDYVESGEGITDAVMSEQVRLYNELVDEGVPEEDARMVLPLGTKVNLSFSANARSLMHIIDMRAAGDAQWEAIDFAEQVLEEAHEWAPLTFELYEEHARGASKKAP